MATGTRVDRLGPDLIVAPLTLRPLSLADAKAFVLQWHRHHRPPQGHKFSIGLESATKELVAVVIAGRPVARAADDGYTLEITRLCSTGEYANCSSMLYGAARRAAWALGYTQVITYTLASESGTSLKASGFVQDHAVRGRSWDTPSRRRSDTHPTEDKICWRAAKFTGG